MIAIPDAAGRLSAALCGGPAAKLAASALVEADALGLPRFGIAMLDEWTADAAPMPAREGVQAIDWLDCTSCFAPLAVASATIDLAEAARQFGVAAVFLRGIRGFGRLAPFVRHLADNGLIGIAGAEGPAFVAPHGGTRPVIGTNPLALAMGQGSNRVVIDVATSTATMADIRNARVSGAPLSDGIALDGAGRQTSIAAEVAALLPRGGQIGSLLGLVVELMAGVAGGGRGDPKGRGVFILAFDPARAGEGIDWQARLAGLNSDWTDGGGHWPRGGSLSPEAELDDDFAQRLDVYLTRMTGQAG
ncbi:(2R)-3-sulfolactate dehydrogenase (NADP+) [Aminobacter aminovorans]|jgi:LDH2 family malate/lactate/ureidoglycolate dehydrogenase|uniref:Ureidoglycolate dehydrogenase n=1 Tax=Aminobacter aminovorans TaxID=83263 RepID=A0A380WJT4_AMIAI|nr:Ldh family oxidoreductase [Aminobacter aminovorans]TCS28580.1 (2R)-3-sulfolactate dehydrogenase (NADP+) [Aminobacter aminovorans]SUU88434.1 Ureidoglycolate dehydrogenase [Aminobacter aminovorans]